MRKNWFLTAAAVLFTAGLSFADPINPPDGPWKEFLFGGVGSFATEGSSAVPSGGGNSIALPDPPWTFSGNYVMTIVDAFLAGDEFSVYDFGVLVGTTSAPGGGTPASDASDPDDTLLDGSYGRGIFALGGGSHSITIQVASSPFGSGAAFFRLDAAPVPEPAAAVLFALGAAGTYLRRRRKARSQA